MLKQIIKPEKSECTIRIPEKFINHEVEISIMPVNDGDIRNDKNINRDLKKTAGILKNKISDPVEWQKKIRAEWDRSKLPQMYAD
mgnify:CR=1 FL=1